MSIMVFSELAYWADTIRTCHRSEIPAKVTKTRRRYLS